MVTKVPIFDRSLEDLPEYLLTTKSSNESTLIFIP